jgi:hypothetical protein
MVDAVNEGTSGEAMLQLELGHKRCGVECLNHLMHSGPSEREFEGVRAHGCTQHAKAVMHHLDTNHLGASVVLVLTRKTKRKE